MKSASWYIFLIIFFVLEGLFPIFSFFAQKSLPTFWLVALATAVSFVFGLTIFVKKKLYLQYQKEGILLPTLLSSLFMWSASILYFFGIEYSSPSTASVLLLLQSLFAFIIFNVLGKEEYWLKQIFGAVFMFVWGFMILYQGESFLNLWAIIMLIACLAFTIWNYYTKKASMKGANPFFLLINRNFLMIIITTIFAITFVWPIEMQLVEQNIVWILLIWFLVLFLGKAAWIMALDKLNPFVAISCFPGIPVFVMIFSFLILREVPSAKEILAFIPMIVGAFLLINKQK